MGIDFFDLTIRLEKRFGVRLVAETFGPPNGPDPIEHLTAAAVAAAVTHLLGRRPPLHLGEATPPTLPPDRPGLLQYDSAAGTMPPSLPVFDPDVWPGVARDIADAVGVNPSEVRPASRLVRDLGMC